QLLAGSALLALGSVASAAAPAFAWLVLAQLPVGVGVAALTTAGTLAAAEWVSPELRTRVLSWALVGQPSAWILGMPLIGLLGEHSWRYGWLSLPLLAAVVAALLVARRPRGAAPAVPRAPVRAALTDRPLACWLLSELFANAAWAGTLVYSGALFTESYGTSGRATGALLAVAAGAYVAGNLGSRRLVRWERRQLLVLLAGLLAVTDAAFEIARPDALTSTVLFSVAAAVAGSRTLISSSFALETASEIRPTVTSLRAATMQFGYFVGSLTAGAALAAGGYGALGAAMGAFLLAAALLVRPHTPRRPAVRLPHCAVSQPGTP
ncbi:MAG TPA: MFS transporter, partial [Gaiellaceae bacterium]|nr:MFS transporter [Gaiellaceae bacterium]